jgi:hypothetical protein
MFKNKERMSNSGSLLPPVLNPSSLYSQEAKRDATRIKIYNSVLQQIYNKIKAVSRIPGNEKSLWYIVPEFIPGTPRFELGDCILYLVWNLRNVGYTVEYTPPTLMFISWTSHDAQYREKQSPWAQVLGAARDQMLSKPPSTPTTPTFTTSATKRCAATVDHCMLPHHPQSAPPNSTAAAEPKRKTLLKKTMEYRPLTLATDSNTLPPAGTMLAGTLSPKHVSFV